MSCPELRDRAVTRPRVTVTKSCNLADEGVYQREMIILGQHTRQT